MSRSRALVASLGLLAALTVVAPSASAQEDPTTTIPPTTVPDVSTTTTAPPGTIPPQPPPPPTTAPITDDPAAGGDAPPEPVPQTTDTVPPRTDALAPGQLPPVRGQVLTLDVEGAKAASDKAQQDLADATTQRTQLEATVKSLTDNLAALGAAGRQAVANLASARSDLTQHAVDAYVRGSDATIAASGFDDSSLVESTLLGVLVSRDDNAVKRYDELKRTTTQARVTTAEQLARAQQQVGQARLAEKQAQAQAERSKFAMAVTTSGGNVVIEGFVFPVAPPYSFSDTYGAPRSRAPLRRTGTWGATSPRPKARSCSPPSGGSSPRSVAAASAATASGCGARAASRTTTPTCRGTRT